MIYGKVKRFMSEKITSFEDEILSYQEGFVRDGNTSLLQTAIPCGIDEPVAVTVTPVANYNGEANDNSAALADAVELVSNIPSKLADLPADVIPGYGNGNDYVIGNLTQHGGQAYVCVKSHTASTDTPDLNNFTPIRSDSFLLVKHAAGAFQFTYIVYGYKDN